MQQNGNNKIHTSINLQKRITASLGHVKMEAFALIMQLDTNACARMITLGATANVSIIVIIYIYFNFIYNFLRIANTYIIGDN